MSSTTSAEFLRSATDPAQFLPEELPEIAFIGRSNVGKSTLLNRLVGHQKLAFTSSTPGRTQSINFYRVDVRWVFVDLPGYGYAKVPLSEKATWQAFIDSYLRERQYLALSLLLVDARRSWMASDLQMKEWLEHYQRPYLVVATKSDKLNQKEMQQASKAFKEHSENSPIWFSALTGQGVKELWQAISKTTRP